MSHTVDVAYDPLGRGAVAALRCTKQLIETELQRLPKHSPARSGLNRALELVGFGLKAWDRDGSIEKQLAAEQQASLEKWRATEAQSRGAS